MCIRSSIGIMDMTTTDTATSRVRSGMGARSGRTMIAAATSVHTKNAAMPVPVARAVTGKAAGRRAVADVAVDGADKRAAANVMVTARVVIAMAATAIQTAIGWRQLRSTAMLGRMRAKICRPESGRMTTGRRWPADLTTASVVSGRGAMPSRMKISRRSAVTPVPSPVRVALAKKDPVVTSGATASVGVAGGDAAAGVVVVAKASRGRVATRWAWRRSVQVARAVTGGLQRLRAPEPINLTVHRP